MSRAVGVLGWGSTESVASVVESSMNGSYETVDVFTLARARKGQNNLDDAVSGADIVVTDSAGLEPVARTMDRGYLPDRLVAFSGPLPSSVLRLGQRCMAHVLESREELATVALNDSLGEIVEELTKNADTHFNPAFLWQLSRLNSIHIAAKADRNDVDSTLGYGKRDILFPLTRRHEQEAEELGVDLVRLNGGHNVYILNPKRALETALEGKASRTNR